MEPPARADLHTSPSSSGRCSTANGRPSAGAMRGLPGGGRAVAKAVADEYIQLPVDKAHNERPPTPQAVPIDPSCVRRCCRNSPCNRLRVTSNAHDWVVRHATRKRNARRRFLRTRRMGGNAHIKCPGNLCNASFSQPRVQPRTLVDPKHTRCDHDSKG